MTLCASKFCPTEVSKKGTQRNRFPSSAYRAFTLNFSGAAFLLCSRTDSWMRADRERYFRATAGNDWAKAQKGVSTKWTA